MPIVSVPIPILPIIIRKQLIDLKFRNHLKITNMKSIVKMILVLSILVIFHSQAMAQQQAGNSDISINALSLNAVTTLKKVRTLGNTANPTSNPVAITPVSTDTLKCIITVNNVSNTNAYGAKLIVVLPAKADVITLPSNATKVNERGISAWPAYVQFDLAVVFPNQVITVEFTFIKSQLANKVSAFVFTTVPDGNPANNYKDVAY